MLLILQSFCAIISSDNLCTNCNYNLLYNTGRVQLFYFFASYETLNAKQAEAKLTGFFFIAVLSFVQFFMVLIIQGFEKTTNFE